MFVESTLRHIRFTDCRLDGASFRGATLEQCVFERCNLVDADFAEATFDAVELVECDLGRADLSVARCQRVFLTRSMLEEVRGVARLRGATVTPDAVVPLAMSAFAALGFVIDEPD